jgi:hypothetical protein
MVKNSLLTLSLLIALTDISNAMSHAQFSKKLGFLESRNNYKAVNSLGYLGKYQFGGAALIDLGYKTNKHKWTCKHKICSKQDFLNNKKIQEKALIKWVSILKKYLKSKGSYRYIGKKFKNIKITEWGLIGASHLVGAGAVNKMLKTKKVPKDGNGVKATKYLKAFIED